MKSAGAASARMLVLGTASRVAARSRRAQRPPPRATAWRSPSCSTSTKRTPSPSATERFERDLRRLEPPFVERLRDVRVHLRAHPPGVLEEDPHVGLHGLVLAEQMREHRRVRARRMRALRDLRELVRVAEQDEVARRRADRERVRERDLPALVDEQRVDVLVELLAREEERRAGKELELRVEHLIVLRRRCRRTAPRTGSASLLALLPPPERVALLVRRLLEVLEELVDRLVAERRDPDPLASLHQRDRHPRPVPRLPRAGRALHEEVAPVEAERGLFERHTSRARGGRRSRISTSAG